MGVGYPLDIVVCVALGVDMFDCVYPCRTARFGTALVRTGQLRLTSSDFANDYRPLEPNGTGPLKDYTRAMLHTVVTKEPAAASMITLHNLHFMLSLLTEMREAIKAATFPAWVRKFLQGFFPSATPPPCRYCPPRWVRDALAACEIMLDDLFDWSDGVEELPDMPREGGTAGAGSCAGAGAAAAAASNSDNTATPAVQAPETNSALPESGGA